MIKDAATITLAFVSAMLAGVYGGLCATRLIVERVQSRREVRRRAKRGTTTACRE